MSNQENDDPDNHDLYDRNRDRKPLGMSNEELEELFQADLQRVGVMSLEGGGYKGTYAHCGHDENGWIAVVTPEAPTPERARDAVRRWILRGAAEEEAKRAWRERASKMDPLRREPEPGPKYKWVEHPEHKGYRQVVRNDTVDLTPCLEPV